LEAGARQSGALVRTRKIESAVVLLRLVLAYCLGDRGLRSTAGWASAMGLADISNVALLYRLRRCTDWLALLLGEVLAKATPPAGRGRLIRLIDATTVPQAGRAAKRQNRLWRVHSAFALPRERFDHFELTDERGGEQLDRIPVTAGEIRIADRAHLQPERMARVLADGADIIVRAGWRNARWRDAAGEPVDLITLLRRHAPDGLIDRPIWIARQSAPALAVRLVAIRKPPQACAAARRTARRQAQKGGHQIATATLIAADWLILLTSLKADAFPTADVLALYRLRWRIELAFKRLKSGIGLKAPPSRDPRLAGAYVLAHLLMILLLEPLIDAFEGSPRWAAAA
jgi:hypothetical protein